MGWRVNCCAIFGAIVCFSLMVVPHPATASITERNVTALSRHKKHKQALVNNPHTVRWYGKYSKKHKGKSRKAPTVRSRHFRRRRPLHPPPLLPPPPPPPRRRRHHRRRRALPHKPTIVISPPPPPRHAGQFPGLSWFSFSPPPYPPPAHPPPSPMPPPPETSFPGFTPALRHAAVDLPVFDWYSYSSPLPPSPPPRNVPPATPPSPPPLPPNPPLEPVTPYVWVNMTADQVRRTLQLTSIFENSNTTLQYDYCGNQHDGRGYTFGYCGFTTRTGDGYQVVQRYTELEPTNILAPFIPELQVLMEQNSGKVQNLSGFCEAVAKAASDPAFQEAQNYVQDKLYFQPAMDLAEQIGIRLPLTKGQLYDAMIQHGEGLNDPFSIDYIIMSTSNATGGIPLLGVDETWWIQVFLYFRGITLERFYPQPHITERLSFYEQLMKDGNWNLEGPIYVDDVQHADGWTILDTYFGTFVIA